MEANTPTRMRQSLGLMPGSEAGSLSNGQIDQGGQSDSGRLTRLGQGSGSFLYPELWFKEKQYI